MTLFVNTTRALGANLGSVTVSALMAAEEVSARVLLLGKSLDVVKCKMGREYQAVHALLFHSRRRYPQCCMGDTCSYGFLVPHHKSSPTICAPDHCLTTLSTLRPRTYVQEAVSSAAQQLMKGATAQRLKFVSAPLKGAGAGGVCCCCGQPPKTQVPWVSLSETYPGCCCLRRVGVPSHAFLRDDPHNGAFHMRRIPSYDSCWPAPAGVQFLKVCAYLEYPAWTFKR